MASSSIPTTELNMRCAGVKRLLKEACELCDPTELFFARPMEDNLFEWHFTVRGPPDSPYQGGVYHGRILLPPEYPMKPPSLILLTPNGRWAEGQKICLSISGYHPETWLPSWSIRTALLALIGFMPTPSVGAIGGLDCSDEERKRLAARSLDWKCNMCDCTMREIKLKELDVSTNPAILQEMQSASKQPPEKKAEGNSQTETLSQAQPTSDQTISQGGRANASTSPATLYSPANQTSTSPTPTLTHVPATSPSLAKRLLDPSLILILAFCLAFLALFVRRFAT